VSASGLAVTLAVLLVLSLVAAVDREHDALVAAVDREHDALVAAFAEERERLSHLPDGQPTWVVAQLPDGLLATSALLNAGHHLEVTGWREIPVPRAVRPARVPQVRHILTLTFSEWMMVPDTSPASAAAALAARVARDWVQRI
jgi:hypothetical protein